MEDFINKNTEDWTLFKVMKREKERTKMRIKWKTIKR
jgi:hypothetical protein